MQRTLIPDHIDSAEPFTWYPTSVWGSWECTVDSLRGEVRRSILPAGWRAVVVAGDEIQHADHLFPHQQAAEAWVEDELATRLRAAA